MIPELFDHLPVYNNLPVPYVAVWSDERINPRYEMWKDIRWVYTESRTGVPDFGSTNSHRQREGMRHGRCQICGRKGAETWVVPDDRHTATGNHHTLWTKFGYVLNPPMHQECYQQSRLLCPHLKAHEPITVFHLARVLMKPIAYTVAIADDTYAVARLSSPVNGAIGRELIVTVPREMIQSIPVPV